MPSVEYRAFDFPVVEQRLRDSFDRPRRHETVLGPEHIRALAYCFARLAIHIEAGTGKRWNEDQFTYEALEAVRLFRFLL